MYVSKKFLVDRAKATKPQEVYKCMVENYNPSINVYEMIVPMNLFFRKATTIINL